MYQETETVQTRRRQIDTAIQLAMDNRWEEAVQTNRAILGVFPNDTDSYNRLGKALMELGRYNDAKKAYKKAVELDSTNQIARKNLERLGILAKSGSPQAETTQVDPTLFIEEMGKTAVTTLIESSAEALTTLNAGERLVLSPKDKRLSVETPGGEFVGLIEPKLGTRLRKLIDGGNEYTVAIASLNNNECKVIVKETYQHPSQAGRPSFPTAIRTDSMRPYTKDSLLRYGDQGEDSDKGDEDEEDLTSDALDREGNVWDSETLSEGHVRLNDAAAAEEALEEEMDE
jgi:tetratricopeptide (TPR) repeat protein